MPEQLVRIHIPATVMSTGFTNDEYIADRICPLVRVPKSKFSYYEFTKSRFKIPELLRAPRTQFKRGDIGVTLITDGTSQYGWEEPIDDTERRDYENDIDLEMEKAEDGTDITMLAYEKRVAALLLSTTNITQNVTLSSATDKFSDPDNSDPIGVFKTARLAIHKAVARKARIAVMALPTFENLRLHAQLTQHFKYTTPESITAQMMAKFFELDEILVGGALYDTAKEGQTPDLDYVWGKDILIAYVERSPGRYRPSLAYTFWAPVKGQMRVVEMYREEGTTSDIVRVHEEKKEKIVHANCGYLIKNAIA